MKTRDITSEFLRCLSDHLSSRQDCKGVEYTVIIDRSNIKFEPLRYVYPDRYHRKENDKQDVVRHVISYHFPDLPDSNFEMLTSGTYKYVLSFDGKKRQWIRQ